MMKSTKLLFLLSFVCLYTASYAQTLSVFPGNGTIFENQVGKDLTFEIFVSGGTVASEDYINLSWTNPDSPLLSEIYLTREKITYDADGKATISYTFKGENGRLDSTGDYNFKATLDSNNTTLLFTYRVAEVGNVPSSKITYPGSGQSFLPGQTITITAEATDGDGRIQRVEFLLGNNSSTQTGNEAYTIIGTATTAPYSTTFTIPGEGEYKLSARAFDERGNSGRSSVVTFFGSYTPVLEKLTSVTMTTPLDGSTLGLTTPPIFTVDVQPVSLRAHVTVDYFVNGYRVTGTPITGSSNSVFPFTWTNAYIGTHEITARAQLNNGTFVETSNAADIEVVGYGSTPEVTLTMPPGGSEVVGTDVQMTATVSDSGSLIRTVELWVNGVSQTEQTKSATDIPFNFTFKYPSPGYYDIWVIATFSNGNRAGSNIIRRYVEIGAAPIVNLVSPIDAMQFLPGTSLPILAMANDPNGLISNLNYFVNDTLIATANRNPNGTFSVSGTDSSSYSYNFPFSGTYRLYVQATDGSGIIAQSETITVLVREPDPTKPHVVMSHPLPVGGGDTVNDVSVGSSMYLNALATDNDGTIQAVKFFINGQYIGSSTNQFRDTYSLFYKPTTPGNYIIFAEAIDNHGKRSHSVALQLNVYPLEAQLPTVEMLPLAEEERVVDAGTEITMSGKTFSGLVEVSQLNFYVNGVLVNASESPLEGTSIYRSTVELEDPGTYFLSTRAIEIDPLGLTTDNWVISDSIAVKVEGTSSNRTFVIKVYQDFFSVQPPQSVLDNDVVALNAGQKSQAQYIYEILEADAFKNTRLTLMTRYLLTGQWPSRDILKVDLNTFNSSGMSQLVTMHLPTFQSTYWDNNRLPDGFSSNKEFEKFVKVLFTNKYGVEPTSDQSKRCVDQLKVLGTNLFVENFIKDIDATPFGSGKISVLLGIPNPPNSRIVDMTDSAVLLINLNRITPSAAEVDSLSQDTLINRIQTVISDPKFTSR